METKIFKTIEQHNMLRSERVIVALSGGADSMALLYFLNTNKRRLGISLHAVHVNHNIRANEALHDRRFVEEYCKQHEIPLTVFSKDIPAMAKESGEGLEECGRRVRYELLHSFDEGAMITTAHHLNDSAETAIFNLIRGTGLAGLRGILPVRGRVIRPLIDCEKKEILAYCEKNAIPFCTDSTNADPAYTRNKIRGELLPLCEEINPAFLAAFAKNAEILSETADFLRQAAEELLKQAATGGGYRVQTLLSAHPAVRKKALADIAQTVAGKPCEHRHIALLDAVLSPGGCVNLPGNKILCSDGKLFFERILPFPAGTKNECEEFSVHDLNISYNINKKTVTFSTESGEGINKLQKIHNKVFINSIDCDTIYGSLVLRSRKNGESVRLFGRGCTKSLKKLLNEAKMPAPEREELVILADDAGIVWLEGFGVSEHCALSPATQRALKVEIAKQKGYKSL
ncbi:MAG: tRNA lysidine(34) synthetase TilS [Oscillospiraceae bacterium]|jgi:tRNA(Ile)-lysidine synthase|nr:tRNA lysidine(34) synthetase TilS [Oscillospiraceae bacterium]